MPQFNWYTCWTSLGADGAPDKLIEEGLKQPDRIKISFKKNSKEITSNVAPNHAQFGAEYFLAYTLPNFKSKINRRVTMNNTPGIMPGNVTPNNNNITAQRRLPRTTQGPHAINILTLMELATSNPSHAPRALMKYAKMPINYKHYANSMLHPVTGETISSYKKFMHNPATAEVWQTAFGKDFGSMAQGGNQTGQKGTNAMYVMTHDEIARTIAVNKCFTYGNPIVDYRPQKEFPHCIRITAGGQFDQV